MKVCLLFVYNWGIFFVEYNIHERVKFTIKKCYIPLVLMTPAVFKIRDKCCWTQT